MERVAGGDGAGLEELEAELDAQTEAQADAAGDNGSDRS